MQDRNDMQTRTIEIRDSATCIPALAIRLEARGFDEQRLLRRVGYSPSPYVILMRIDGGDNLEAQCDPYQWHGGSRTMPVAHNWIEQNMDKVFLPGLASRIPMLIDVQHLLGETDTKKTSEL